MPELKALELIDVAASPLKLQATLLENRSYQLSILQRLP
jgi:hypothetical protein